MYGFGRDGRRGGGGEVAETQGRGVGEMETRDCDGVGIADCVGRWPAVFSKPGGVTKAREGGGAKVAVRWWGILGRGDRDHSDGTGR